MLLLLTIALLVALFGVVKPFKGFERKHFGMAAVGLFIACIIVAPSPDERETSISGPSRTASVEPKSGNAAPDLPTTKAKVDTESVNLTGPQQNALRSAQQYLNMTGFSKKGLIEQLSSEAGEGYSVEDATAAVDSLSVDWNENAAKSARQYLDISGFSCKGLIQQLSSSAGSGYTVEQATYGARAAGAC